jgi:ADP-ribose pyrophosphatase
MNSSKTFGPGDVELIKRETLYQGFCRIDRLSLRHRLYAGGMGPVIVREIAVRRAAAAVLIYDPQHDEVLLIEQFRAGALASGQPWQVEVVAGLLEPGEDAADLVRREAREEAGVELTDIERIMEYLPSSGGSDEMTTLFVGRADLTQAGGVHGLPEEGEDIRVNVMSVNQALSALANGRIANASCIITLQWLALNKARLLARWKA